MSSYRKFLFTVITTISFLQVKADYYFSFLSTNLEECNDMQYLSENGNIDLSDLSKIRATNQYLYLLGTTEHILRVKKDNLKTIHDTIFLDKTKIKQAVFESYFGADYRRKVDTMNRIAQLAHVPEDFMVRDIGIVNDTVLLLTQFNYPFQTNATNVRVERIPSIVKMSGGKIWSADYVDNSWFLIEGDRYYLQAASFEYLNGDLYFNIRKDSIAAKNYFIVKTQTEAKKIRFSHVVNYQLPQCLVQNKVGYLMSRNLLSDGLFSNSYSDTLYDLKNNRCIALGITYKNYFTYEQALSLSPNIEFCVYGLSKKEDTLSVIYGLNKEIWLGTYTQTTTGKVNKMSTQKISQILEGVNPFSIVTDKLGFYCYNYQRKQFQYTAYADFR